MNHEWRGRFTTLSIAWLLLGAGAAGRQVAAVPLDPKTAILDAFAGHRIVAIGDAHGNREGAAFQLALIRDPRFPSVASDILIESGNARYQADLDRYVRGEEVPRQRLQQIWLDTTQQHVASLELPDIVAAVRTINATLAPERRLRILLGEPPIEWERMKTADDFRAWSESAAADRDRFAAAVIRREVLAKNRRVLALYGAGHFFRKVISSSLVTILEADTIEVFTVWTNAAAEMAAIQADVATWPVPSLALLEGTTLGRVNLTEYYGPGGKDIPEQWRAPLEEQFDAILYVGPIAKIALERPQPWRCSEPAMAERLRRLRLQRPALADRVAQECVR